MDIIITDDQHILEVHTSLGLKLILLKEIIYIEAFKKGSVIYLDNQESVLTNYLLKMYDGYLPLPYFYRCHNSYMVNCSFVDCFCSNEIILKNKSRIPLSRRKKQPFKDNMIVFYQNS